MLHKDSKLTTRELWYLENCSSGSMTPVPKIYSDGEYVEVIPGCFVWRNFVPKQLTAEDYFPLFQLLEDARRLNFFDKKL